jgi:hypothetical protein
MVEKIKRERGRPQKLNEGYKQYIARVKQAHPDWSVEKIREKLFRALYDFLKEKHPDWSAKQISDKATTSLPGLSSIQKYLKKDVILNLGKESHLEQPWHFGLMSKPKYSIPAEAVPFIFMVQDWLEQMPSLRGIASPQKPLTIRQALWIGRLYKTFDGINLYEKLTLPEVIYLWAEAYANHEAISALSGTVLDTTMLDQGMRRHALPVITVLDGKSGYERWPVGSLVEAMLLHKNDLFDKLEQIRKDGEQ